MKQIYRLFIMASMVLALPATMNAQEEEVYDFITWKANKPAVALTLDDTTPITATSGTEVFLVNSTFAGTPYAETGETPEYDLQGRFAFQIPDATKNNYGWTKLESYQGLHLRGKNYIVSIQGLKTGDIIVVESPQANATGGSDGLYIKSKNVSYVDAEGTVQEITEAGSKLAGTELTSGVAYTMLSDGTFDFSCSASSEYFIHRLTIRPAAGDDATGISAIDNGEFLRPVGSKRPSAERTIDNYFDLQGRHVAAPTKGIYVKGGKKYILK